MANMASAYAAIFYKETVDDTADIICIDGKAMKGTTYENGRNPDIVSAFPPKQHLLLQQTFAKRKAMKSLLLLIYWIK